MDTPRTRAASLQSTFRDGLGTRHLRDGAVGPLEVLTLHQHLTTAPEFEARLRERITRLAQFRQPQFTLARDVESAEPGSCLAVISDHVAGVRLSRMLALAEQNLLPLDVESALCLIRKLVTSIAMLHEAGPDAWHGALAPERIVITPDARLVVVEQVLGSALEQLRFSPDRYWTDLRIVLPPAAAEGEPQFSRRTDVVQVGMVALALLLGRPLGHDEHPDGIAELASGTFGLGGGFEPLPQWIQTWLSRALWLDPKRTFASAVEARHAFDSGLASEEGRGASQSALEAFLAQYRSSVEGLPAFEAPSASALASPPASPSTSALSSPPEPIVPKQPARVPEPIAIVTPMPTFATPAFTTSPQAVPAPVTPAATTPAVARPVAPPPTATPAVVRPVASAPAVTSTPVATSPATTSPATTSPVAASSAFASPATPLPTAKSVSPAAPAMRRDVAPPRAPAVAGPAQGFTSPASATAPPTSILDNVVAASYPRDEEVDMQQTHSGDNASSSRRSRQIAAAVMVLVLTSGGVMAARRYLTNSPESAPGPGTLAVATNPAGARVVIDGEQRGVTPLRVTVKAGPHTLELSADGVHRTIPVTVTANAELSQFIEMPKAVAAFGQLDVRTDPSGAKVSVDGQLRGMSPLTVTGLATGSHMVMLENELGSVNEDVTIEPGATASLVVPLKGPQGAPVSGWISITAPAEVQVFENQRLLGSSRTDRIMVTTGRHDLEIVNEALGYRSAQTVQVGPGQVARVKPDWPQGTIAINASPWAIVSLDGQELGETPVGNTQVPVGTHEVVFRHPQLGEQRYTATVTASTPTRLSVDMRKK